MSNAADARKAAGMRSSLWSTIQYRCAHGKLNVFGVLVTLVVLVMTYTLGTDNETEF